VGPKAGLEDVERRKFFTLQGLELRPLGRPTRSQSLYRKHFLYLLPPKCSEDGSNIFLKRVDTLLSECTVSAFLLFSSIPPGKCEDRTSIRSRSLPS
jgi:hypothetical protein